VSVHIRQVGDWTKALGERVGAGPSVVQALTLAAMKASEKDEKTLAGGIGARGDFIEMDTNSMSRLLPVVRIDGPYGAPAEDVFQSEVAVLIGAGIGTIYCEHIDHLHLIDY
jgi:NADPH oxidase 1